jgi:hypothetical protein
MGTCAKWLRLKDFVVFDAVRAVLDAPEGSEVHTGLLLLLTGAAGQGCKKHTARVAHP